MGTNGQATAGSKAHRLSYDLGCLGKSILLGKLATSTKHDQVERVISTIELALCVRLNE